MAGFFAGLIRHSFFSAEKEAEFRKSHLNPVEIRRIILFGMLVYCLYLFLDVILFPESFTLILIVRIGLVLPIDLILFFLTFSRFYNRFSVLILLVLAVVSATGIILIEYIVRENAYAELYFYGIAQVLILFYGTGKINLLPSVIFGLIIVIPAIAVDAVFIETDPLRILTKSLFLITMTILGLIASSTIQNTARARFTSHKKIEELSMTDSLTGLRNRHFYQTLIIDEIADNMNAISSIKKKGDRASDNSNNCCYAFIVLDIDFFKKINDKYGHDAGDQVLKEFSNRIFKIIRSDDSLIRWGGEEFLLLLRNMRIEYVSLLVSRIKEVISENPFEVGESTEKITVSGGLYVISPEIPDWLTSADDVFELADKALYFSKHNGRDRFTQAVFEDPVSNQSLIFKNIGKNFLG